MKFENPKMNISMFEVENVVTTASGNDSNKTFEDAQSVAAQLAGVTSGNAGAVKVVF